MVLIGGLALVLVLGRFSSQLVLWLATISLTFGLPLFCTVRGPAWLRWGFIISTLIINVGYFVYLAYHPVSHDAEVALIVALLGLPTYLWTGIGWANSPWDRRHQGWANVLVIALISMTVLMARSGWPWDLASTLSSPALNRLADRIQEGGTLLPGGEWAGVYRVRAAISYPGAVSLFTVPPGNGSAGFTRTVVRPRPAGRWESIGTEHDHEGRWHVFNSE